VPIEIEHGDGKLLGHVVMFLLLMVQKKEKVSKYLQNFLVVDLINNYMFGCISLSMLLLALAKTKCLEQTKFLHDKSSLFKKPITVSHLFRFFCV
jgi:hypothetical protein